MGDMNELMNANEKCGSGKADIRRINMFCDYVKQCGFLDLGYSGPAYTWTNKRFSTTPTFQRLDRCLANAEWCMAYPRTTVYHLPMRRSDHAPILTMLDSTRHHNNKIFRFKNWWLMEQDYMQVAKESWMKSYNRPFHQKTKYLATDLRKWRMAKPNLSTQINIIESQMLSQPSEPPQEQDYDLQQHLAFQHQNILTKDEEFHLQRAKKNWARLGDRNTAFFHQSIVKRHRKNTIAYLHNPDGTDSTTADQIASTLLHYFHELFAVNETNHQSLQTSSLQILTASHSQQPQPQEASHHHSMRQGEEIDHHHQTIDSRHTNAADDISCFTNSTPNLQELHSIIKGMRNNASPGPDSLNAAFFKTAWPWISNDVHNLVSDFYRTALLTTEINQTYITLIQKKVQPITPQDFRPISLYNVIYRLIAKTLADRLKPHLPNYIDQEQAAFIKDRHISSNIIITQEIIHSFGLKNWNCSFLKSI